MTMNSPLLPLPGDRDWLDQVLGMSDAEALQGPGFLRAVAGLELSDLVGLAEGLPAKLAAHLYTAWLSARPSSADTAPVHFNLGVALQQSGQPGSAASAFAMAQRLRPDLWQAALAQGAALESAGHPDAALAVWRAAIPPAEARRAIHVQLARLLEDQGALGPAMAEARDALLIAPDQPDVIQHLVHNRQRCAVWPPLALNVPGLTEAEAALACGPLAGLALFDDPVQQTRVASDWVRRKVPEVGPALAPRDGYAHDRMRLGFLSSDFGRHAMSFLVAQLLEKIDRRQFEVFGYCTSPNDGSEIRQRVLAAFDCVHLIRDIDDAAAAAAIRADEIDVLIDLNGLTKGARPMILRHRPAPVQATYLGYIGPVPLPELDYLICDAITVPPTHENAYGLRPLRIAGCYQANDNTPPPAIAITRRDAGLPEESFVFACHSHHYKVTEAMFGAWCAILRQVPASVLWLIDDNPESRQSLTARFTAGGLSSERLIFAPRAAPDLYRARLQLADLFLDTAPYNAGTIASDCLRMGLPVLTVMGQAFCARMAASLLTAVGLTEGIAADMTDYIARAVGLATNPARLAAMRAHLAGGAWNRTLGDSDGFARRFEAAMASVVLRPAMTAAKSDPCRMAEPVV